MSFSVVPMILLHLCWEVIMEASLQVDKQVRKLYRMFYILVCSCKPGVVVRDGNRIQLYRIILWLIAHYIHTYSNFTHMEILHKQHNYYYYISLFKFSVQCSWVSQEVSIYDHSLCGHHRFPRSLYWVDGLHEVHSSDMLHHPAHLLELLNCSASVLSLYGCVWTFPAPFVLCTILGVTLPVPLLLIYFWESRLCLPVVVVVSSLFCDVYQNFSSFLLSTLFLSLAIM